MNKVKQNLIRHKPPQKSTSVTIDPTPKAKTCHCHNPDTKDLLNPKKGLFKKLLSKIGL